MFLPRFYRVIPKPYIRENGSNGYYFKDDDDDDDDDGDAQ